MFKVATLYKFIPLNNLIELQQKLQSICRDLTGTLLVAPEGINGTIAGVSDVLEHAIMQIRSIPIFHNLWHQYSQSTHKPFRRLKIRVKKEIITMAQGTDIESMQSYGQHVLAQDWHTILDQVAVIIDVRNDYEYRVGTFEGAIHPHTTYFSQFPFFVANHLLPYKDKPIAMFCTGGIRCEKASAYMLGNGFEKIYQLHGGILQYLANIPQEQSRWQGECFVFDERISLGHGLQQGSCLLCYGCRMPLTQIDLDEAYKPGMQCKYCCTRHNAKESGDRK